MNHKIKQESQKVFLDKLTDDLKEARNPLTPSLYLEIEKRHCNLFSDTTLFKKELIKACTDIYDSELTGSNKTNVIIVDSDDSSSISLVGTLLGLLDDDIQKALNEHLSQTLIKSGITYTLKSLSGGLTEILPTEFITDPILDVVSIIKSGVVDLSNSTKGLVNLADEVIDFSINKTFGKDTKVVDISNKLNITEQAQNVLKRVILSIQKPDQDEAEAVKNILDLIIALGLSSPKLILITQPEKLDNISICILLLMLGYEKKLIDSSVPETTNVSFCLAFTDEEFQPSMDVNSTSSVNLRLLKELHTYAQRYQLLEIPDNNRPKQAIAPSTFVGRAAELESLRKRLALFDSSGSEIDPNNHIHQSELILGESGAGKTSLIQQHILQTFQPLPDISTNDTKQSSNHLFLSLFNTNAISSRSSGLASLKQSIEMQSRKLEEIISTSKTQRFKKHIKSKLQGLGLLSTIGGAFNITSEVVDILAAANIKQNKDFKLKELSDRSKASTGEAPRTPSLQLFENINKALSLLIATANALYEKQVKITFFIDDIQWLDDLSAQYIAEHLLTLNVPVLLNKTGLQPIRLLVTGRSGDLENRVVKSLEEKNTPFLNLIEILHPDLRQEIKSKVQNQLKESNLQNKSVKQSINSQCYELSGFNTDDTNTLLEKVFTASTDNKQILSMELNRHLGRSGIVNTMHLVESINMLCDPLFYQQNKFLEASIVPLVEFAGRKPKIIADEDTLKLQIEKIFEVLKQTYAASFSAFNNDNKLKKASFNLSALAVFEERLRLVQSHVGSQYAEVCKHSLFIANLLSEPFDRDIIEKCITAIAKADTNKFPNLLAIRNLFSSFEISLDNPHYDVLDEIYNIISKMEGVFVNKSRDYQVSHALWELFLTSNFENWIHSQQDDTSAKPALVLSDLCYCLIDAINHVSEHSIDTEFKNIGMKVSISGFAYKHAPNYWAYKYITYLRQHASLYRQSYDFKSIKIFEQALSMTNIELDKEINKTYLNDWRTTKRTILHDLAHTYSYFGFKELAHKTMKEYESLSVDDRPTINDYNLELATQYEQLKTHGAKSLVDENGVMILDLFNPIAEYEDKIYETLNQKDFDNESHFNLISEHLNSPRLTEGFELSNLNEYYYLKKYIAEYNVYHGKYKAGLSIYLAIIKDLTSRDITLQALKIIVSAYDEASNLFFEQLNNPSEGFNCLQESIRLIQESKISHKLSILKSLYQTHLVLGYRLFQHKKWELASQHYEWAREIIENNQSTFDVKSFQYFKALNGKANCLIRLTKYPEAIDALHETMEYLSLKSNQGDVEVFQRKLMTLKALQEVHELNRELQKSRYFAYLYFDLLLTLSHSDCQRYIDEIFKVIRNVWAHEQTANDKVKLTHYLMDLGQHAFTTDDDKDLTATVSCFYELAESYEKTIYESHSLLITMLKSDASSEEVNYVAQLVEVDLSFTLNLYSVICIILKRVKDVVQNIEFYIHIQEKELSLRENIAGSQIPFAMKLGKTDMTEDSPYQSADKADIAFKYLTQCRTAYLFPETAKGYRVELKSEMVHILDELLCLGYLTQDHYSSFSSEIEDE
jgi:hypothetical protein